MNSLLSVLAPDPRALLAHERQAAALPSSEHVAPDMREELARRNSTAKARPMSLAVCSAVPLTLKELSDRTGIRLAHPRIAVDRLGHRKATYHPAKNALQDTRCEQCGIGVHFTGGSANNHFSGNAFLGNEMQVKYTGLKFYEWSHEGRGNYWSDNPAFDLDGNGIADAAYRPNTLVDWVLWKYPLSKLLVSSPAMQTLRYMQEQLPTLYPGGAVDSFPLMEPGASPVALPRNVDLTPAPRDPAQASSDRPIM